MDAKVIGHNEPPLRDRLAIEYDSLMTRRDDLLASVARVPEVVDSEQTADRLADFIKQLKTAARKAEDARKAEKAPHLNAGRAVDSYFKDISDPLDEAAAQCTERLNAWQTKAEVDKARTDHGTTASTKTLWAFRNVDVAKLDLEALRPYFAGDAFDYAIRNYIRDGHRKLRGVEIFETTRTIVR